MGLDFFAWLSAVKYVYCLDLNRMIEDVCLLWFVCLLFFSFVLLSCLPFSKKELLLHRSVS